MNNYSSIQIFLHDLVLNNNLIKKSLYEIEKIFFLKKVKIYQNEHIFITGLPRSGTTVLLNFIFSFSKFASLKYKNMPFITSPNFSKLFLKKEVKIKERFHQDGIMFNLNSPEAFDEVFLNTFDEKIIKNEFQNFVNLILLSQNKDRYLSKNNFLFKRINQIKTIFPKSKFIIPIREPLQHSYSLLKQHIHFSKLQKKNDFVRRYMNYLGHFEFGLNHRYWYKPIKFEDTFNINYWLEQWILFYNKIFKNHFHNKSCMFIRYEDLTNRKVIEKLVSFIGLPETKDYEFKSNNHSIENINYDEKSYSVALNIYDQFNNN